jgi:phenylpropionate dioxygenase-like ring-hydroxylating dioxygenase large terminal subunit
MLHPSPEETGWTATALRGTTQSREDDLTARQRHEAPDDEHTDRFVYWLAVAARQVREHAGIRVDAIVNIIDPGHVIAAHAKIDRFEKNENTPRDLEAVIAAYAQAVGVKDARDIYQRAMDLWYGEGEPPQPPTTPDAGPGLPPATPRPTPLPPLSRARTARRAPKSEPPTDALRPDRRRGRA